jgi:hypothetical protein
MRPKIAVLAANDTAMSVVETMRNPGALRSRLSE